MKPITPAQSTWDHKPGVLIEPSLYTVAGLWISTAGSLALCFKVLLVSLLPLWACWGLLLTQGWWILGLTQSTRSMTIPALRYGLIWSPLLLTLSVGGFWTHDVNSVTLLHHLSARLGILL